MPDESNIQDRGEQRSEQEPASGQTRSEGSSWKIVIEGKDERIADLKERVAFLEARVEYLEPLALSKPIPRRWFGLFRQSRRVTA